MKEFDYARVDWYIHEGRIYFGEITFTPGAGLVTGLDNGLNQLMGKMWLQYRAPNWNKSTLTGVGRILNPFLPI